MKKIFSIFVLSFLISLAACVKDSDPAFVNYKVVIKNPAKQTELVETGKRVITRLLEIAGQTDVVINVTGSGGNRIFSFELQNSKLEEKLLNQLNRELTVTIRPEVPLNQADIVIADTKGYKNTDFKKDHLVWAELQLRENQPPIIKLELSSAGGKIAGDIFNRYSGSVLGLFVRGQLVNNLKPEDLTGNYLVIDGAFSDEIAGIFVDDVNLGLYAEFSNF